MQRTHLVQFVNRNHNMVSVIGTETERVLILSDHPRRQLA